MVHIRTPMILCYLSNVSLVLKALKSGTNASLSSDSIRPREPALATEQRADSTGPYRRIVLAPFGLTFAANRELE